MGRLMGVPMNSLSLRSTEPDPPPKARKGGRTATLLIVLLLLCLGGLGYFTYLQWERSKVLEQQLAAATQAAQQSAIQARQAAEKASAAEYNARTAAEGRQAAEGQAIEARQEAATAQREKAVAVQTAEQAKAEAERVRKRAEADVARLEGALGQIAETRRTQLGLVMNLGSDHLKFAFDKAELGPSDRELLSRVAGILATAHEYTISVNGHTDDVGSAAYNKKLSERRAQAVRDYLVQAGLSPEILSVEGHGKSLPLVKGTSDAARAKNRRVELGIVNTNIKYASP
jgi:outer membrane protein OmpA-like peptidoglycan-associated protein